MYTELEMNIRTLAAIHKLAERADDLNQNQADAILEYETATLLHGIRRALNVHDRTITAIYRHELLIDGILTGHLTPDPSEPSGFKRTGE